MATDTRTLLDATKCGDVDEAQEMLEEGCLPNIKDGSGLTPLHLAAKGQNSNLVELLLEYGADPDAKDNSGSTPLNYAAAQKQARIVQLLLDYWANPNNKDSSGSTPLHNVAIGGSVAIAKLLVKSGADVGATNNNGEQPIHVAEHEDIATVLAGGELDDNKQVAQRPLFPIRIHGNHLDESTAPKDFETDYILIQIETRLSPSERQVLEEAGLAILDYVSKNTYLCYRDRGLSLEEVGRLDPVIYVDIYREELKVAPGLRELDTNVEVDVILHGNVDLGSEDLRDRITWKASDHDKVGIQFCGHKVRLTVQGLRISRIAEIDEVRRIERVGKVELCDSLPAR